MYKISLEAKKQLAPHLERILIYDNNMPMVRMVTEHLRQLGAPNIVNEIDPQKIAYTTSRIEPRLIVTTFLTGQLDGIAYVKALRRSLPHICKTPVLMLKNDITTSDVQTARDAGVNEILFIPFSWQDFIRRLSSTLLRNAKWINLESYTGPDRRRHNVHDFRSDRKRRDEDKNRLLTPVDHAALKLNIHTTNLLINRTEATLAINAEMKTIINGLKGSQDARLIGIVNAILNDLKHTPLEFKRLKPLVQDLLTRLDLCQPNSKATEEVIASINEARSH